MAKSPGLIDIIKSVIAAMFGVQSEANRERDFKHGKASHFIAIGIVMTVIFVLTLVAIVSSVVENAGLN
ncbi:MAG: DUF2970 domain-containing protein [Gammaproteobacteria bacterium]|jgi:hypothetical protein